VVILEEFKKACNRGTPQIIHLSGESLHFIRCGGGSSRWGGARLGSAAYKERAKTEDSNAKYKGNILTQEEL
jgi:hypothetical protein